MTTSRAARYRIPAIVVAAIGISSGLVGCSTADDTTFRIVTTTTHVTDFTRNIVGDASAVYPLLQANQSAHSFDPSAKDLLELSAADVLVISGAELEPWVDDALTAANFNGEIIDASTGITLLQSGETEAEHDHAAEEAAAEEAPADEHDHLHADGDPHIWTSPANAELMVTNITDGLVAADPENASIYTANAESYIGQLAVLDEWVTENIEQVAIAERLLVTNHDAFTYFVSEYGITFVGSIIPEFDDNAEPSAADIDALVEKIRETGVRAIFAESSISSKLAEAVAAQADIEVFAGDESLYSDSLGATGSGAETYISATIHNVRLLDKAWGVEPLPVPEEIANA
ncbi:MAG: metal ABC transporter substrate-binding protein [Actinobacteria bacterium]|nr:metal ABC transporter substrate-binding protein [Actinomycetota bacterium]